MKILLRLHIQAVGPETSNLVKWCHKWNRIEHSSAWVIRSFSPIRLSCINATVSCTIRPYSIWVRSYNSHPFLETLWSSVAVIYGFIKSNCWFQKNVLFTIDYIVWACPDIFSGGISAQVASDNYEILGEEELLPVSFWTTFFE